MPYYCGSSHTNRKLQVISKHWLATNPPILNYGQFDKVEVNLFIDEHPILMEDGSDEPVEKSFKENFNYQFISRDFWNQLKFWLEDMFGLEGSKNHFKVRGR